MDNTHNLTAPPGGLKVKLMAWLKSARNIRRNSPEHCSSSSSSITLLRRSRLNSSIRISNSSRPLSTDVSFLTSSANDFNRSVSYRMDLDGSSKWTQVENFPPSGLRRSLSCDHYKKPRKNDVPIVRNSGELLQQHPRKNVTADQLKHCALKLEKRNKENVAPVPERKSILKSSISSSDCLMERPSSSSSGENNSSSQRVKGHITFEDQQPFLPRTSTIIGDKMLPMALSQSSINSAKKSVIDNQKFLVNTGDHQSSKETKINPVSNGTIPKSHFSRCLLQDRSSLTNLKCLCTVEKQTSKRKDHDFATPTIKTLCSECQVGLQMKHKTLHAVRSRILTERMKRKNICHYIQPDMTSSRLLLNRFVRLQDEREQNGILADDECSVACSCYQCLTWDPRASRHERAVDSATFLKYNGTIELKNGLSKLADSRNADISVGKIGLYCKPCKPNEITSPGSVAKQEMSSQQILAKRCESQNDKCSVESLSNETTIKVQVHTDTSSVKEKTKSLKNLNSLACNAMHKSHTQAINNISLGNVTENRDVNITSNPFLHKKELNCSSTSPNLRKKIVAWYENIEEDVLQNLQHSSVLSESAVSIESPIRNKSTLSRLVEKAVKQSIEHLLAANALPILQSPFRSHSLDDLRSRKKTFLKETPFNIATESKPTTEDVSDENKSKLESEYGNIWDYCSGKFCSTPNLTVGSRKTFTYEELKRSASFDCLSSLQKVPARKPLSDNSRTTDTSGIILPNNFPDDLKTKENHFSLDGLDSTPPKIGPNCSENFQMIDELIQLGKGKHSKPNPAKRTPTKKIKYRAIDVLSGKAKLKLTVYKNGTLLTVNVLRASSLSSNRCHSVNCYVKVSLYPDESQRTNWRTNVIKSNNNPTFNQIFSFELLPEDRERRLMISVWHRDIINRRSEFLGCMTFGIRHIIDETQHIRGWYRLLNETVGAKKHFAARR